MQHSVVLSNFNVLGNTFVFMYMLEHVITQQQTKNVFVSMPLYDCIKRTTNEHILNNNSHRYD